MLLCVSAERQEDLSNSGLRFERIVLANSCRTTGLVVGKLDLQSSDEIFGTLKLRVNAALQVSQRDGHCGVRRDTLTFDEIALPRIPSRGREAKAMCLADAIICSPEDFAFGPSADDGGRISLRCECRDHFGGTRGVFVRQDDDATVIGLVAEPLRPKRDRAVLVPDNEAQEHPDLSQFRSR